MDPSVMNAKLVARTDLNQRLAILRIRPDSGAVPDFEPGQFIQLGLPFEKHDERGVRVQMQKRAYSIASSPLANEELELFLAYVQEGRLTPELWKIPAGGRCWIDDRAHGTFTLERVPSDRDLVMVATGTGLAPYVSMLRTHSACARGLAERSNREPRWRRFVIVHGARQMSDLAYEDEFRECMQVDASVGYLPVLSREPEGSHWTGLRGRVQSLLEGERCRELGGARLDPESCHVFLCGNPDMIDSVRAMLAPRGFVHDTARHPGNLHFERYW